MDVISSVGIEMFIILLYSFHVRGLFMSMVLVVMAPFLGINNVSSLFFLVSLAKFLSALLVCMCVFFRRTNLRF